MTADENLAVFWRALAQEMRKVYPSYAIFKESIPPNGITEEEWEILWKHYDREEWWAWTLDFKWDIGVLAELAQKLGKGFAFSFVHKGQVKHWRDDLCEEESATEIVTMVRPQCEICKMKNLLEIEFALAKGIGYVKLAQLLNVPTLTLRKHHETCMKDRVQRLSEALGFALDAEQFLGASGKLNLIFEKANQIVDKTVELGDFDNAGKFLDRMTKNAEISAELSGEKVELAQGNGLMPSPQGQVNVVVMPTATRQSNRDVVDLG